MIISDKFSSGGVFKKCCKNLSRDLALISFASLPLLTFFLWRKYFAVSGGFFCDDRSLMFPLKPQTVTTRAYLLIGIVLVPLLTFITAEFFYCDIAAADDDDDKSPNEQFSFRKYLSTVYSHMFDFVFGFWIQLGLYIVPKFLAIELRPHFFAACVPLINGNSTCADPINYGRYITDYECSNPDNEVVFNAYLSFPSGHASGSFYAAFYLCGYVQSKVAMHRYVRLSLQYLLLMMATFVAVSRIADHYHHWIDVLVGAVMGAMLGLWMNQTARREEQNKKISF